MLQTVNTLRTKFIQLFVAFFILSFSFGYSQNYHFSVEYLTKKEGLSNTEITSVVQDKSGFIWIGTQYGLNKFDGYSVKVYQNIPGDTTSLSDNSITSLFVDSKGDLWIGTENNGISVYDRNRDRFVNYRHEPLTLNSLSNQFVTSIKEDSKGNIWVGTTMGLNKYQRSSKDFKRYLRKTEVIIEKTTLNNLTAINLPVGLLTYLKKNLYVRKDYVQFCNEVKSYSSNQTHLDKILKFSQIAHNGISLKAIEIDNHDNILFAFENDSIGNFNPVNNNLEILSLLPKTKKLTRNIHILSLCWNDGQLWIGTKGDGMIQYDSRSKTFSPYKTGTDFDKKLIKCIIKDSQGEIWVGNEEGLNLYSKKLNTFFRLDEFDEKLLSADVSAILEDNQGNYWVASYQGGINILKKNKSFDHYKFYSSVLSPAGSKSVSSVLEDSNGNLWVGYFTSGIDLFLKGSNRKISFSSFQKCGLGKGTVFKIFEDSKKNIWIGTYEGGLQRYDQKLNKFVTYTIGNTDITDVRGITEDLKGNLWIAIHGNGVKKFNYVNKAYVHYKADYVNVANSLANDWVNTIFCDRKGRIWAGSSIGLSVYDPHVGHFVTYNTMNSNLSHIKVLVILEDSEGRVWVGTENGLNLFNEATKNFSVFTTNDGLVNNYISGLAEDDQGSLWISTYNGLSRFDYKKDIIKNFLNNSGLQATEFSVGASSKGKNDKIYFGAKNGLIGFYPNEISYNLLQPPVIITDFKLFNKSVPIGESKNSLLTKHISETRKLELPYNQNVITFEFTAINYIDPKQNTYAYMLEGFEKGWNYVGTQRSATYTNLYPGHYTFRVIAANNDGIWNYKGTAVEIIIKPPIWLTVWAKILYVVMFLIVSFFIRKAVLARIRLRNKIEVDEMKLRFFANISHELRTPLTLILGPMQQLSAINELDKKDKGQLVSMLNSNGHKLLRLVNQLMNIYEVDAGVMKLKVSEGNLVNFTKRVFDTFYYYAVRREIAYSLSSTVTELTGFFDADKLEMMLSNIISNALKYSSNNSSIEVVLSLTSTNTHPSFRSRSAKKSNRFSRMIEISIEDKGKGISQENQKKIFDRFFRVESDNHFETGTGIGLSLAKQLAKLHRGDITVTSKVGKGSVFTIILPIDREAYLESEIDNHQMDGKELNSANYISVIDVVKKDDNLDEEEVKKPDSPILVIIDDSEDIRRYIRYCFKSEFQIIEVEDGEKGLDKVFEIVPDIIICDVMLPGISGIDVCATIKRDWRTSHIPIILLTAKIGEDNQLRGLEEGGADDYVTKPFNVNLLSVKIKNILSYKKRLRQVLQMELQCQSKDMAGISSADDNFIKKAVEIVEKYMDDLDFNVEILGKELGLSQTNLYRKLQGVVGLSAIQFIKNIRLKKAAQILEAHDYSVTEVAFMVGFADAKYFSKTFKKQFGMLPKEYGRINKSPIQNVAENSLN